MSTSARAMIWAHCDYLSGIEQTAWLPGSYVPWTHPLIHDTRDITESFQKLLKTSFVHAMLAIRLVFFWCKSGVATIKLQLQCLEYFKLGSYTKIFGSSSRYLKMW